MLRRCLTLLGLLLLLMGCGRDNPVQTGIDGPEVQVADQEFHVTFKRANGGRLLTRIDRDGRFLQREQPVDHSNPEPGTSTHPWQLTVKPLSPTLGSLRWRRHGEEDRVLGRVPIISERAAHSGTVQNGDLQFVVWVEQQPGTQRLMLAAVDASSGEVVRQILKDGVAENASPAIGLIDQQLLLAYVRRGRLKTKLVRLPGVWFPERSAP